MAQKLLHDAEVGAALQQMRGKAVAQGVRANAFVDIRAPRGALDGLLEPGFQDVVAPFLGLSLHLDFSSIFRPL